MIKTLGHLPECPMLEGCHYWSEVAAEAVIDDEHRGNIYDYCPRCGTKCICSALRACEQRMLDAYSVRTSSFQQGYAAGLSAARDAVEALSDERGVYILREEALAVIDAMREER